MKLFIKLALHHNPQLRGGLTERGNVHTQTVEPEHVGSRFKQLTLKCVLLNARSLRNKIADLHKLLYTANYDCICITESWLNADITNGMLDPQNAFHVLRYDRTISRGGGICVFIRNCYELHEVNLSAYSSCLELICFDMYCATVKYRFFVAYRPTASSPVYDVITEADYMTSLVNCFEINNNACGPTFIMGDFNCPNINWKNNLASDDIQARLCNFALCNGYTQCVTEPTRLKSLLDILLTNDPILVSDVKLDMPFSTSDHCVLAFDMLLEIEQPQSSQQCYRKYMWSKADYNAMSLYLNSVAWTDMLTVNFAPDDVWNSFCNVLNTAIDMYVPYVDVDNSGTSRSNIKKYPRHIQALFARKRCLWRLTKRQPDNIAIVSSYRAAAIECRRVVRNFEIEKEKVIIESRNAGTFFKYVNRKLRTCSSRIGILRDENGSTVVTDDEKANLFNSYFNSVNVDDNGLIADIPTRVSEDTCIDDVEFTPTVIRRIIRKIKPKYTCGPDGYPPFLIKSLIDVLDVQLSLIYQSFMSIGKLPTSWKTAIITPFYKKGPSSDPANYRPISLTSVFCKIMERIIVTHLSNYLLANNLINKQQHGFLANKSTETNLLESVNDWTISIENKHSQTVAYIDFARAFDSVCHSKLLLKLNAYGVKGTMFKWIADFLTNRSHCTRIGDSISPPLCIRSGVIQGSVLGPVLFLLYINDVVDVLSSSVKVKLFADDVKLYTSVQTISENFKMQENLNKLSEWANTWQLKIANSKCNFINIGNSANCANFTYNINNSLIKNMPEISDLGVIMDTKLKFSEHINKIVSKAHIRANLILRCFHSKNTQSLVKAYKAYVRPILEYCSTVWSPFLVKDITKLETVQRQFTKRLPGLKSFTYPQRLHNLEMESLEIRRLRNDLSFAYKIIFGRVKTELNEFFTLKDPSLNLRGHQYKLSQITSKTTIRQHFFSNRIINIWNSLPLDSTDFSNIKRFKKSITTINLRPYSIL